MGFWQRLRDRLRRPRVRFNLHVEPTYAIQASAGKPYFQSLEQRAREAGYLGQFVVDEEGRLRPGSDAALATKKASLTLDVYPNPAAVEGRSIADYEEARQPRHAPRVVIVLEDDTELFLHATPGGVRVEEPASRFRV